jgi:hypothetical protein
VSAYTRACGGNPLPPMQDDTPVCSVTPEGPPRLYAMTARHWYSATCPHCTAPRTPCDRRRPRLSQRCSHSPSCDHRTALPTLHATAGCRQTRKPFRCSSRPRDGHPGYARRSIQTGPGMASGAEATRGPGGPVCPANPVPWHAVADALPPAPRFAVKVPDSLRSPAVRVIDPAVPPRPMGVVPSQASPSERPAPALAETSASIWMPCPGRWFYRCLHVSYVK